MLRKTSRKRRKKNNFEKRDDTNLFTLSLKIKGKKKFSVSRHVAREDSKHVLKMRVLVEVTMQFKLLLFQEKCKWWEELN